MTDHKLEVLAELADTVAARRYASPDVSYTAKLLSQGIEKCAKKVGEEAVETALAAVRATGRICAPRRPISSIICSCCSKSSGTPLADVMTELAKRARAPAASPKKPARKTV